MGTKDADFKTVGSGIANYKGKWKVGKDNIGYALKIYNTNLFSWHNPSDEEKWIVSRLLDG